jgi:hypothetical protein
VVGLLLRSMKDMPAGGGVMGTVLLPAGGPTGPLLAEAHAPIQGSGPGDTQWTNFGFSWPVCVAPGDTCCIATRGAGLGDEQRTHARAPT